jgi:hypothetical protein
MAAPSFSTEQIVHPAQGANAKYSNDLDRFGLKETGATSKQKSTIHGRSLVGHRMRVALSFSQPRGTHRHVESQAVRGMKPYIGAPFLAS